MTTTAPQALRVAQIGYAFMGAAHSQAWRTAPRFFDLPLRAEMTVICGRSTAATEGRRAARLGGVVDRLAEVVARDDIDIVDMCTPGDSHAEIAIAALEAGKHVLCEKPLANTVAEAEEMTAAAAEAAAARRPLDGRLQLPPGAGAGARPRSWSPRAGSARSARSARSTCRTGSSTRSSRWRGGCRRTGPDPARWATSARTSSTWPSS